MTAARRKLIAVAIVMASPIVLGSGLFLAGWRPADSVNRGTLVVPPRAAPAWEGWRGKWSLALVRDNPCRPECTARLDELRRVRLSFPKEAARIQVVPLDERPDSLPGVPPGSVVLVDPNGRVMLRYDPGADARGMRADLERLLKYSWTG